MKFTPLIPTTRNDGTPIPLSTLARLRDALWRPFKGMTEEGEVTGHWIDADGAELDGYAPLVVDVVGVTSAPDAASLGWISDPAAVEIGDAVTLPYHPLGTDYLGRDMLARLMHGARVSLFIGIVAPLLFVLTGILYGSAAGFAGDARLLSGAGSRSATGHPEGGAGRVGGHRPPAAHRGV